MDLLQIIANVSQIIGTLWVICFGGIALFDVLKKKPPSAQVLTNFLLALVLVVLISLLLHPPTVSSWINPGSASNSTIHNTPSVATFVAQPTPTPDPRLPQVQQTLQDFCTAYTRGDTQKMWDMLSDQAWQKHRPYSEYHSLITGDGLPGPPTVLPTQCRTSNIDASTAADGTQHGVGAIHYTYGDGHVLDCPNTELNLEGGQWKMSTGGYGCTTWDTV